MKPASSEPSALEVEQQLRRILASPEFQRAERSSRFLQFVVSEKIAGKGNELKETVIGVEVYSRAPGYDPRTDPIVRMEASRLRLRLQEYYANGGAGDPVRIELPKGGYAPAIGGAPPSPQTPPKPTGPWGWVAAGVFALAAAIGWFRPAVVNEMIPAHFLLSPPDGTRIASRIPTKALASIAPDGKSLILVAEDNSGQRFLWLRPMSATSYGQLEQTDGASYAFWSPDSQTVGFIAEGKLKRIPFGGGPVQTICDLPPGDGEGATWSSDGSIIFAPPRTEPAALPVGALSWVSAIGGAIRPATTLDVKDGELSHSWPQFLPNGHHFLYLSRNRDPEKSRMYVQELGSKDRKVLQTTKVQASYAPGPGGRPYLLFPRDRALMAQPLDLARLELTGAAVPVAEHVSYNTLYGTTTFSVSNNGTMAYRSGNFSGGTSPIRQLAWYTRRGDRMYSVGQPGYFNQFALSPDESRIAVDKNMRANDTKFYDIWIIELATGVFTRLTQGPQYRLPVWSPDSRTIAAVSEERGQQTFYEIPLGSGVPKAIATVQSPALLESWSPDGRFLWYSTPGGLSFRLPLAGDRTPQPVQNSEMLKRRSRLSPNGRWIAYQSTESGRNEVYTRSFPEFMDKRQISSGGGAQPLWSKDGKELYYLTLNTRLMSVDVKAGGDATLEVGKPRVLFQTPLDGNPLLAQYAASGDGQRFVMMENIREGSPPGPEQFHVQLTWFSGVK